MDYQLTATGRELLPFIDLLESWGLRQMAQQGIPGLAVCELQEVLKEETADF